MLFTEPVFLFYFLPFSLLALRMTLRGQTAGGAFPERSRLLLFALTLVFYGFHSVWWLYPFLFAILCDFGWASLLRRTDNPTWRRFWVSASVVQNLGLLALFKYRAEFLYWAEGHWPAILAWAPEITVNEVAAALPAGISFYTFESLSFVIDIYRREVEPPKKLTGFLSFIGMFPRFVAGPIVRYREIASQLADYSGMQVRRGLLLFAGGLVVKVCLADSLALFVPYAFGAENGLDLLSAWVGVLAYTLQLYLDFSAYSQMAIGLGICLGFKFPENFNLPYHASSVQDFWRRWHMTLSRWLRDYVYISLGGNRVSRPRQYLNLFLTMVIGGIWHGSGWGFLIWGIWHGLLLCAERAGRLPERIPSLLYRPLVFLLVLIGWVPFRAANWAETVKILTALAGFSHTSAVFNPEAIHIHPLAWVGALVGAFYVWVWEPRVRREEFGIRFGRTRWAEWAMIPLTVWGLIVLFGAEKVPFLYFQF